jgi:hypothetical protein
MAAYSKWNLSLLGRITVIKTLVIPKMIHVLSILPVNENSVVKEAEKLIKEFIWNGKKPKTTYVSLAQTYEDGGLKLTHLPSLINALRITWVKRLMTTSGSWQSLAQHILGVQDTSLIWNLDPISLKNMSLKVTNPFWSEVLKAWRLYKLKNSESIIHLSLWNTHFETSENLKRLKTILITRGCIYLKDIINEEGRLLLYGEFVVKFYTSINHLDFYSLVQGLPTDWKNKLRQHNLKAEENTRSTLNTFLLENKSCNHAYWKLIKDEKHNCKTLDKWENNLNLSSKSESWPRYFLLPFTVTTEAKLISFQFKILRRIIVTNKYLNLCKIKSTDKCSFCGSQTETIEHLFWQCQKVHTFWQDVYAFLWPYIDIRVGLNEQNVILGYTNYSGNNDLINFIFLIVKRHIYVQRCKGKNLNIVLLFQR